MAGVSFSLRVDNNTTLFQLTWANGERDKIIVMLLNSISWSYTISAVNPVARFAVSLLSFFFCLASELKRVVLWSLYQQNFET